MDTPRKKLRKSKVRVVKFDEVELRIIQEKADLYTKGNFSRLLRKAAVEYEEKTANLEDTTTPRSAS